jgi:hypothetical protein
MAGGRGGSLSMQQGTETRSEQHNSSAGRARARTQHHKIFLAIYFSYLAKFGYKLNMKVKFRKKKPSIYLFSYLLELCV